MALVDLKSNLSQIDTDSRFGRDSMPSTPPPNNTISTTTGVDFFPNTNAFGFTTNRNLTGLDTDFRLNNNGGPIIPQIGNFGIPPNQWNPKFLLSATNKSVPNIYNTGTSQTPLQQISIEGLDSFVNFGSISNRYGYSFVPPFSETNKLPTVRPDTAEKSRIYFKHTQNKSDIQNAGFTRFGLGLDNYYAQAQNDNGIFGQRNDSRRRLSNNNQPKVIRNIGQRWGANSIQLPSPIPKFVSKGVDALLSLSAPVFGRDISVFADRYKADTIRLSEFVNPISTYAIKQTVLHRQNKYDRVASQLYGLGGNQGATTGDNKFSQLITKAAASGLLDINPQVYNQASIFSVPGVPGMMFNKNGRNFGDVASLANEALGIAGNISLKALQFAAPKAVKIISTALGGIAGAVGQGLNALGGVLGSIPIQKETRTNFALGTSVTKTVKTLGQLAGDVRGSKVGQALTGFGQDVSKLVDKGIKTGKRLREQSKTFTQDVGLVSKHQASKLDPRAFEDVSVDRVNLIPYGSTKYKEDDYTALDLIPFKFADARLNNSIVFRAILSGITDTFSPEYSAERYVGRPDNVYVYQGTTREISFNFDVYPKSDTELVVLWEKLNYLAGLTYPHWTDKDGLGKGMIAPFSKLTIGQMYDDAPGYISSLSYTVQDNTTWEVEFAKLPKYIQVSCTFVYIGNRLPSATQKHFDVPWVGEERYKSGYTSDGILDVTKIDKSLGQFRNKELPKTSNLKDILGFAGL